MDDRSAGFIIGMISGALCGILITLAWLSLPSPTSDPVRCIKYASECIAECAEKRDIARATLEIREQRKLIEERDK